MASLKKVSRSKFWYIRHRDIETGTWRDISTPFVRGVPADDRRAQKKADEFSAKEANAKPETGTEFVAWVPSYITQHYRRESTKKRSEMAWVSLREWMAERNVKNPRQLKYEHAQDYMAWRKSKGAKHNTARMEAKFLSFLMNEAVRRDYCDRNVIEKAKIERIAPKEKPEIGETALIAARQYLLDREAPEWMLDTFEILMNLGCRFAEASIPIENIDFANQAIRMIDSKRDDDDDRKYFTVPITDQFAKYLEKFKGRERTVPLLTGEMNFRFNRELKRACGATSHSFRVTFITRCHRAGLSEQECMRLVNHSSRMVHRIYTRLNVEDSRKALGKVPLPPPPPPSPGKPSPT